MEKWLIKHLSKNGFIKDYKNKIYKFEKYVRFYEQVGNLKRLAIVEVKVELLEYEYEGEDKFAVYITFAWSYMLGNEVRLVDRFLKRETYPLQKDVIKFGEVNYLSQVFKDYLKDVKDKIYELELSEIVSDKLGRRVYIDVSISNNVYVDISTNKGSVHLRLADIMGVENIETRDVVDLLKQKKVMKKIIYFIQLLDSLIQDVNYVGMVKTL